MANDEVTKEQIARLIDAIVSLSASTGKLREQVGELCDAISLLTRNVSRLGGVDAAE